MAHPIAPYMTIEIYSYRGLICVMKCPICAGGTLCYKCEIKSLKQQLAVANDKFKVFLKKSYGTLNKSKYNEYSRTIDIHELSTDQILKVLNFEANKHKLHFVTLTFDPVKFPASDNILEQKYINKVLFELSEFHDQLYGCYEIQKQTGRIHAHYIVKLQDIRVLEYEIRLKDYFTDNPKNKYAIKILPMTVKALDYINKADENLLKPFYQINIYDNLSDDYVMPDDAVVQPTNWVTVPKQPPSRQPHPTKPYNKFPIVVNF